MKTLTIHRRELPRYLSWYLILLPLFSGIFLDLLGLPGALRYTGDLAWCTLAVLAVGKGRLRLGRDLTVPACLAAVFFLYTLAVILFRYQSGIWYLWGLRNNFRFYIAFFAFAAWLDQRDVERIFRLMDRLFWVNFVVSLIQFAMGYQQDLLGGIFGLERGRNAAYTVLFFLLVLTRSLLSMMEGRENLSRCLAKCAAALITAALAEMFGFFLMFGMLVVLAACLTRFSRKKCLMLLLLAGAVFCSSSLLLEMFGEGSQLSWQIIRRRLFAENYATREDLGRLTAIPTLSRTILTEWPDRLFGLGLGNCDTSTFRLCNSDFYQQYSHLHYTWFLSAFLFLETGYGGLFLYLAFFLVLPACVPVRGDGLLRRMGIIMAAMCILLTFYNSALRSEAGYLAWFGLALPFVRPGRKEAL